MDSLRTYLNSMPVKEQGAFATRCGTSIGYLRKCLAVGKPPGVDKIIAIERESKGAVTCESINPDIDWDYLRNRGAA